jgi:hypothetical protein
MLARIKDETLFDQRKQHEDVCETFSKQGNPEAKNLAL